MNYKTSLILQIDQTTNSLDALIMWFEKKHKIKFTTDSIKNQANITLINLEGESIKIATVREVKEKLGFGSYYADKTQYFIFLNADLTTIPAQNALLKSIEEPPTNTQLIFITHVPEKLLETIRSRCKLDFVTDLSKGTRQKQQISNEEISKKYQQLINATYSEKIELASKYKDRVDALQLCNSLVFFLHKELKNSESKLTLKKITSNINRLLKAIDQLEHNTNVLLTLENCFFEL